MEVLEPLRPDPTEPGAGSTPARKPGLPAQVYLAVWRWHFWAGLLISPVLLVLAATGALIVFQPQIELWRDRPLYFVEAVGPTTVPLEDFASAVARELPGFHLTYLYRYPDPRRAWDGFASGEVPGQGRVSRRVFFDPYRGRFLGAQDYNATFFRQVIGIHRTLLAGLPGRLVTETATSWGIISLLSGLYLWWPRTRGKIRGVWLPRVRGAGRALRRDWHAVTGMYFSLVLLVILGTGLFFSHLWGTAYRVGNALTAGFPDFLLDPPRSTVPATEARRLTVDEIFARAARRFDFSPHPCQIGFPAPGGDGAFEVMTGHTVPWKPFAVVFLDAYDGRELLFRRGSDLPWRTHLTQLFYPVHTGGVLGWPTQVLALLACLVLMALTILGLALWWRRRPPGTFGAPRRPPDGTIPAGIAWLFLALALCLPTVGITLLGGWALGYGRSRCRAGGLFSLKPGGS